MERVDPSINTAAGNSITKSNQVNSFIIIIIFYIDVKMYFIFTFLLYCGIVDSITATNSWRWPPAP